MVTTRKVAAKTIKIILAFFELYIAMTTIILMRSRLKTHGALTARNHLVAERQNFVGLTEHERQLFIGDGL